MAASRASSSRWEATSECPGVQVADGCWILGGPGQSCPSVCGGRPLVDEHLTLRQSSSGAVVLALTVRYGLPPWQHAEALDRPCEPTPFDPAPRAGAVGPSVYSASFLYLHEAQTWGCFQGEQISSIAPVFRAGCACLRATDSPSEPLDPTLLHMAYAFGLVLLVLGLCGLCCWCGVPARPGSRPKPATQPWLFSPRPQWVWPGRLLWGLYPSRCGEFHPDSPLFRMSAWRIYQGGAEGDEEGSGAAMPANVRWVARWAPGSRGRSAGSPHSPVRLY